MLDNFMFWIWNILNLYSIFLRIVIRSFDVNKPGCEVEDLQGGVAGRSILRGFLKVNFDVTLDVIILTVASLYLKFARIDKKK